LGLAIAVTGASGFVGGHLQRIAADAGIAFHAVSRALPPDEMRRALQGAAAVVHLAGLAHVQDRAPSEKEFFDVNAEYAGRVAQAARDAGIRRFVYVSSIKVNGERTTGTPFRASDVPAPADAYGRSKLAGERLVQDVAAASHMESVIVRPPMVIGPGARANFARLVRLVRRGLPLPFGAVDNRRSLVGVDNLCTFLLHCTGHPAAADGTFLIADEPALSTPQLVGAIAAALQVKTRLISVPPRALRMAARLARRADEAEKLFESLEIDSSETRRLRGWAPPQTLATAIALAAQSVQAQR
jgi:nucleoside-diphosphate-sugar epimerase